MYIYVSTSSHHSYTSGYHVSPLYNTAKTAYTTYFKGQTLNFADCILCFRTILTINKDGVLKY